jgi:hypothetical protein
MLSINNVLLTFVALLSNLRAENYVFPCIAYTNLMGIGTDMKFYQRPLCSRVGIYST